MSQLTTYGAKFFTNCLFGRTQTPPANYYLGLATQSPYEASSGSNVIEPSSAFGYSRATLSNTSSGYIPSVIAKKIVSNVATLVTSGAHNIAVGTEITVNLNDPQFDRTGKLTGPWSTDAVAVTAVTTNTLNYSLTSSNIGGAISNIARSSNVVTVTVSAAHNLVVGQSVYITGSATSFNGTFLIDTVPSTTTFTFAQNGANASSTTGDVYATAAGTVYPFVNIIGARQITTSTAQLYSDDTTGISAGDYVKVSVGPNVYDLLNLGADFVSSSSYVSGIGNSLNLLSYADAVFEGTNAWTATQTHCVAGISSASRSTTTCTIVTYAAHGLSSGNTVVIANAGNSAFNGTWTITVTNATTFTFTHGTSGTISAVAGGQVSLFRNLTTTVINKAVAGDTNALSYTETMALGANISTIARSGTTVTVTTSAAHGFTQNMRVSITNTTTPGLHGVYTIATAPTTTTFTYTHGSTGTLSGTGGYVVPESATTFTSPAVTATAGSQYGASAKFKSSTTSSPTNGTMKINWYSNAGGTTLISQSTGTNVSTPQAVSTIVATDWTAIYENATAPGTTASARASFTFNNIQKSNFAYIKECLIALTPKLNSANHSGPTPDRYYVIRVSAITSSGETPLSNAITAYSTNGGGSITASWTAYPGATAYRVFCGYSVTSDLTVGQYYINSQVLTIPTDPITGTSVTWSAYEGSSGITREKGAIFYPPGKFVFLNRSVSITQRDSISSDDRFSPATGGAYGYLTKLTQWQPGAAGATSNIISSTFGPATTADWGTITDWILCDAASGGNVLAFGRLDSPVYVAVGDSVTVSENSISFKLFSGSGQ